MKTVLILIISISLILYSSGMRISLFPLKIEFPNWVNLIGLVLIMIGAIMLTISKYHDGYNKGYKEGFGECRKFITEIIKEQEEL